MTRAVSVLVLSLVFAGTGAMVIGQEPAEKNPAANNPHLHNRDSIRYGQTMYRVRCADCHGLDAAGYRGPDLTAVLGTTSDERIFQTIRKGVPGTEMPSTNAPDEELLMVIAYLRNLSGTPPAEP